MNAKDRREAVFVFVLCGDATSNRECALRWFLINTKYLFVRG